MPRFTQEGVALLKRIMLQRAPDYHYKPEDIENIRKNSGYGKEQIQHWARQLRWKLGSNLLPAGMTAEEFLKASFESLDGKVMFLPFLSSF